MISTRQPLILGSGSPRRREILETLRIPLRIITAHAKEDLQAGDTVDSYLQRVVRAKWDAVTALPQTKGHVVLVADTIVALDGAILGKPVDASHAKTMLRALSGKTHEVFTRFAVGTSGSNPSAERTVRTEVTFRSLTEESIERYVRTGEGADKAGAYAIQGIGVFAVAGMNGSYTNVVGLPAGDVVEALLATGLLEGFPL